MKKRYAFFGGGFNPPTRAHIELAKQAVIAYQLDMLFFVPVGNLYEKKGLIEEQYRYEMLKVICDKDPFLEVSDIELRQQKPLKAIDVFHIIQERYGENQIYYVMGADNFQSITKWEKSKELLENFEYIILNRTGSKVEKMIASDPVLSKYQSHFHLLENEKYAEFRSGIIREKMSEGKIEEVKKYTDPDIVEYMIKHHLYEI